MRTQETIKTNEELKIVRLKGNVKFLDTDGYYLPTGYCFLHPTKGYVSFDGVVPYIPRGGKKALESIVESGGFLEYDSIKFVTAA